MTPLAGRPSSAATSGDQPSAHRQGGSGGEAPPLASPFVYKGVGGTPRPRITAGNHVSLTRTARSAFPAIGPRRVPPCVNGGEIAIDWLEFADIADRLSGMPWPTATGGRVFPLGLAHDGKGSVSSTTYRAIPVIQPVPLTIANPIYQKLAGKGVALRWPRKPSPPGSSATA